MSRLIRFLKEQRGATAVEYAIMVGLIAATIIGFVALLGQSTNGAFNTMATTLGGLSGS